MSRPFNPLTLLDPEPPDDRERLERVATALCGPVPWESARDMIVALLDHILRAEAANQPVRIVATKRGRHGRDRNAEPKPAGDEA